MSIADKTGGGLINKAPAAVEPPDMSDRYNTQLSPDDEAKFQDAAKANPKLLHDTFDYDTRGDWKKSNNATDARGHGTDEYKKPNHPTFSTGSVYNGADGHQGGEWSENADKTWNYSASPTNVEMHGKQGLKDYFQKIEPGNTLALPTEENDAPAAPHLANFNLTPEKAAQSGGAVFR